MVTEPPPELGRFGRDTNDVTGGSNVKSPVAVPITAPTVMVITGIVALLYGVAAHVTAVDDVHDVVVHSATGAPGPSATVADKSTEAKLSPDIVTWMEAEVATL
jgi:hypothetical protein